MANLRISETTNVMLHSGYTSSGLVHYDWPNRRMRFDGRTSPDTDDDPDYTEITLFSAVIVFTSHKQ